MRTCCHQCFFSSAQLPAMTPVISTIVSLGDLADGRLHMALDYFDAQSTELHKNKRKGIINECVEQVQKERKRDQNRRASLW